MLHIHCANHVGYLQ